MRTNLSLPSLLLGLITGSAPKTVVSENPVENKKVGTTIRFDADTRRFIETQAGNLGISVQEFVAMTFKAIMNATVEPQATELELMADRFIDVFTKHGIPVANIPEVLPEGVFERSDFLERKYFINKLDDHVILYVSEVFNLNVNWLKGMNEQAQARRIFRWYKNISGVAFRLALLNHSCHRIKVLFVSEKGRILDKLYEAQQKGDCVDAVHVGVVIQKEMVVNGVGFSSYESWESERWNYHICRHYLKAIMMFCTKTNIPFDGVLLERESVEQLFNGNVLVVDKINHQIRDTWYPEQTLEKNKGDIDLSECGIIKALYNDAKLDKYEIAIKQPYLVKDWERFKRGIVELEEVLTSSTP